MGVQDDLDWYESKSAENFEIKVRRKMGVGGNCIQIKILNSILTLTDTGLTYAADRRHVDLLASSMRFRAANSIVSPGVKEYEATYEGVKTTSRKLSLSSRSLS